jgi:hypothetical protein
MGAATTTPDVADTAMAAVTDGALEAETTVAVDRVAKAVLTVADTAISNSSRSI